MEFDTVVHSFNLGDVDDPEIYAAHPIWEWEQTEQGRWVKEHAIEVPCFYINSSLNHMGFQVTIRARFHEQDYTFFKLKYK